MSFGRALSWGINFAMLTNILQFVFVMTKRSRAGMPLGRKWGPLLCVFAALLLIMVDPTRWVMKTSWGTACTELDRDANPGSGLGIRSSAEGSYTPLNAKYDEYCYSQSVANWNFAIYCTWSGFILLLIGTFWVSNIAPKIVAQWRLIRVGRRRAPAMASGDVSLIHSAA